MYREVGATAPFRQTVLSSHEADHNSRAEYLHLRPIWKKETARKRDTVRQLTTPNHTSHIHRHGPPNEVTTHIDPSPRCLQTPDVKAALSTCPADKERPLVGQCCGRKSIKLTTSIVEAKGWRLVNIHHGNAQGWSFFVYLGEGQVGSVNSPTSFSWVVHSHWR